MEKPEYYVKKHRENLVRYRDSLIKNCEECGGKGYIQVDDTMFTDCACSKEFIRYKNLVKNGFPEASVENYKRFKEHYGEYFTKDVLKAISVYFDKNLKKSVIILKKRDESWGTNIIAEYFFLRLCKGKKFSCVSASHVNDLFYDFDGKYENCLEYLKYVDVLLVEEFTKFRDKDGDSYLSNRWSSFLSERMSLGKMNIISTTMRLKTFAESMSKEFVFELVRPYFLLLEVDTIQSYDAYDGMDDEILENFSRIPDISEVRKEKRNNKKDGTRLW